MRGYSQTLTERRVDLVADGVARAIGVVALCGIGLIHFIDLFGKWHETRYVAVLYLGLIAGTLLASAWLLGGRERAGWTLGAFLALATGIGYAVSRLWGLPDAGYDVGNWTEPLGAASLFVEGFMVLLSAAVLMTHRATASDRSSIERGLAPA